MYKLPKHKGWFVDFRLREFRQANNPHEKIPFDTDIGDLYLAEFIESISKDKLVKLIRRYDINF